MTADATDVLDSILADTEALAATITDDTLDVAVPSCPGWTLRDLAHHLGEVQRWARLAVVTGAPPRESDIDAPPASGPDEAAVLRSWLLAGARALVDAMRDLDPAAPTWHPFPVPQVVAVWPRRQAHEVAVHRWDAQNAIGGPASGFPLGPDFVAEYFDVIVPRVMARDGRTPPRGRLVVRVSETATATVIDTTDGTVKVQPVGAVEPVEHGLPELAGRADDLVLALWRRQPLPGGTSSSLAAAWLEFGGN